MWVALFSVDTRSRGALSALLGTDPAGEKPEQQDIASLTTFEIVGTHIALPANLENLALDVSGAILVR